MSGIEPSHCLMNRLKPQSAFAESIDAVWSLARIPRPFQATCLETVTRN